MTAEEMMEKARLTQDLQDISPTSHAGRILELVCGPDWAPEDDVRYYILAGQIAAALRIHKSEASRQLRMLTKRRFVERLREGRYVNYRATRRGRTAYQELFESGPRPVIMMNVEYAVHPLVQDGFWALSRNMTDSAGRQRAHEKLKVGTFAECEQAFDAIRAAVEAGEKVVVFDTLPADIDRSLNS